jgi:hypothetical protein
MRVCLLHAGTHKTGTTSLQQLLGTNDEALSAAGVFVPKRGRPFETADIHGAHHNVAWQFIADSRFNPSAGTLADVISEIRAADKPVTLLSSEDFEYLHSRPAALFHIRRHLEAAGFTLKIVLYLRRQDDYARSLYRELFNHGWDRTVEQFVDAILMDGMIVYRNAWVFEFLYSRLLASFALMLGAENIIVRRFVPQTDNSALPVDFMTLIRNEGVDLRFSDLKFPERLNQSRTDVSAPVDSFAALRSRFSADNATVRDRYGVDLSRWIEAQPMASSAQYSMPIFG